jgi:hypothetical protein
MNAALTNSAVIADLAAQGVAVSPSVAQAVRMFAEGRLGEAKYQPMEALDERLRGQLETAKAEAFGPKVAPKAEGKKRAGSLGPAGAYRKAELAAPKTIPLLYVGLYKPVWEAVGPMAEVKVVAAEGKFRGPTQKAAQVGATEAVTAMDLINRISAQGHKNAEGVVSHMINVGLLAVIA